MENPTGRITINMDQETWVRLNKLRSITRAELPGDIIRDALRLYEYAVSQVVEKGQQFELIDPVTGERREVDFFKVEMD